MISIFCKSLFKGNQTQSTQNFQTLNKCVQIVKKPQKNHEYEK